MSDQYIHSTLVFTAGGLIVATVGLVVAIGSAGFQGTLSYFEWQQAERNAAEEAAINDALRKVCREGDDDHKSAILVKECLLQEIRDGVLGVGILVEER